MHDQVLEWIDQWATDEALTVLDIGGRDVNGTSRHLFPNADYTVLDIREGAGVDIVANAATWTPDREFDLVLCTEVYEHTPDWPQITATAYKALRPGGTFLVTCAAVGRAPHSAITEGPPHPGEYYENVDKAELHANLTEAGFSEVHVQRLGFDLQAAAVR
jgi:hypothetical protein